MGAVLGLGASLVALAFGASCLPGDERPTPGRIEVTVAATPSTQAPFETSDGWVVTIARFVAAIGDVRLQGEAGAGDDGTCSDYAETRYERLYDFAVTGREKVGLVYGLGTCNVSVRLQPPSDDPVLGAGATEADVARMRLRASDDYAEDARTSLDVIGSATKGETTLTFAWSFRRSFQLAECPNLADDGSVSVVRIEGGSDLRFDVEVRAEELFRRSPSDLSALQFGLFAEADALGDGDGDVTLAELAAVEAPTDELLFEDEVEAADDLQELVYDQLYLRVVRVAGGQSCKVEVRDRGPGGR